MYRMWTLILPCKGQQTSELARPSSNELDDFTRRGQWTNHMTLQWQMPLETASNISIHIFSCPFLNSFHQNYLLVVLCPVNFKMLLSVFTNRLLKQISGTDTYRVVSCCVEAEIDLRSSIRYTRKKR